MSNPSVKTTITTVIHNDFFALMTTSFELILFAHELMSSIIIPKDDRKMTAK